MIVDSLAHSTNIYKKKKQLATKIIKYIFVLKYLILLCFYNLQRRQKKNRL